MFPSLAEYIQRVAVKFSDRDDCVVALDCHIGWAVDMDNMQPWPKMRDEHLQNVQTSGGNLHILSYILP